MKKTVSKILCITLLVGMISMFFGCSKAVTYQVDYNGSKDLYVGAKDRYEPGTQVKLYFDMIATDTDYSFYLDDEPISYSYDERKGFVITFTMPEHDVSLRCETKNSMIYVPAVTIPEEPDVMLLDYYEAAQATEEDRGYEELVLYTTEDPLVQCLQHHVVDTDGKQTVTRYHIPYHAADICYTILDNYDVRLWNEMEDAVCLDGMLKVCKFLDDEQYVRVSTEQMPADGETVLNLLRWSLEDYMTQENLVAE